MGTHGQEYYFAPDPRLGIPHVEYDFRNIEARGAGNNPSEQDGQHQEAPLSFVATGVDEDGTRTAAKELRSLSKKQ